MAQCEAVDAHRAVGCAFTCIGYSFAGRGPNEGVTSERQVRRHGHVCDCDWLVGWFLELG